LLDFVIFLLPTTAQGVAKICAQCGVFDGIVQRNDRQTVNVFAPQCTLRCLAKENQKNDSSTTSLGCRLCVWQSFHVGITVYFFGFLSKLLQCCEEL
jgi:hypothetical protein